MIMLRRQKHKHGRFDVHIMSTGLTERKSLIIKFMQMNIFQDFHIPPLDAQNETTCEKVQR